MHPPIQLLDKIKVLETQQHAVVVDYSDAHGLCYGVVFPNANGHSGRTNNNSFIIRKHISNANTNTNCYIDNNT